MIFFRILKDNKVIAFISKSDLRLSLLIFIFALLLRLLFVVQISELPESDAASYDATALSIISGNGFVYSGFKSFAPPLHPTFLAVIYYIFGHNYLVARIFQALMGALVCSICYFIGKRIFNKEVGTLSVFVCAINPAFIYYTGRLTTETLFTLLFAFVVLYLLKDAEGPSIKSRVAAGILLGLAALTRPIVLLFPVVILVWICLTYEHSIKEKLMSFVTISILMAATILPWTARNYMVHQKFIPIATEGGMVMWSGINPPEEGFGFNARDEVVAKAKSLGSEYAMDRYLYWESLKYMLKHPVNFFIKLGALKFLWFWYLFDGDRYHLGSTYNIAFGLILSFSIVGMVGSFRKWRRHFLLYSIVLYFSLVCILAYGSPRFRLPIEPYLIIFGAFGIYFLLRERPNRVSYIAVVLIFGANLFLYFGSDAIKAILKSIFSKTVGLS